MLEAEWDNFFYRKRSFFKFSFLYLVICVTVILEIMCRFSSAFCFRMSRVCLTLLSAMVAQGPDSARDVYSHFDFNNKFLPGLLKKRCKKVS